MVEFIEIKKNENYYSIKKKGKYIFFLFNVSGNLVFSIESENCHVYIFGIFLGKNKDSFSLKTIQHHKVQKSLSNLLIKGVFFENSRFSYEGLIRIEKEAQKSVAYQKNQNLILSENCYVESCPFLEILANDVYCTHGSTTSRLPEDGIYYLNCRGFSEKEASEILVEGFLGDVFEKMTEFLPKEKVSFISQKIYRKLPKRCLMLKK